MILPFFLALFGTLFSTVFLPNVRLLALAPFFGICYTQKSFLTSLWVTALCGLLLDLLCSRHHFGLYALLCCITTLLTYHQKWRFFNDKPLSLAIFTFCISVVLSTLQLLVFDSLRGKQIFTDVIGMSLVDALYAFIWFTCPIKAYYYIHSEIKRFGWKAFFLKRLKTDAD